MFRLFVLLIWSRLVFTLKRRFLFLGIWSSGLGIWFGVPIRMTLVIPLAILVLRARLKMVSWRLVMVLYLNPRVRVTLLRLLVLFVVGCRFSLVRLLRRSRLNLLTWFFRWPLVRLVLLLLGWRVRRGCGLPRVFRLFECSPPGIFSHTLSNPRYNPSHQREVLLVLVTWLARSVREGQIVTSKMTTLVNHMFVSNSHDI